MLRQTNPQIIFQRLAQVRVGAAIPADIYIADRVDGSVPRWVVIDRRAAPRGGVQLLVEDQSPEQLHLKAATATGAEGRPRFAIEAFPDRIRGTRVYAGEHGWPRSYPLDLVHLAQSANRDARTRAQAAASRPAAAVQPLKPPSPWYQATVKDGSVLPAQHLAALPSLHGFHLGTQIVVRFYQPGKWAAWDKEIAALVVEEAIAKRAFVTRKDGRTPLLADNQEGCEAGFRAALARRAGKRKNSEGAK